MHNFNYWLQDRDVKYFKEFYLLKGFFFNEQGEPEQLPKPQFSKDNRYRLIPKPGVKPDTASGAEGFDPQVCVKVRLGLPDSDELIQKYENAWRAANAKNTAPNQAQNAVNVAASRSRPFPRTGNISSSTSANVGSNITQQIRAGVAGILRLDMDQALQGQHDSQINMYLGGIAIKNNNPTYQNLDGRTIDTFKLKQEIVKRLGNEPNNWDKENKDLVWEPTREEADDIRNGKYNMAAQQPQKTSSGAYFTIDPNSAAARVRLYTNSYGTDKTEWRKVVRLAAGISPIENARQLEYVNRFVIYFSKNGPEWWKWTEEEQKNAGLVGNDALFGRDAQPVAALTPAEDQELKKIKAELSQLTAQYKKIEDLEKNNSETMPAEETEKLLAQMDGILSKIQPLEKKQNELESKMQQNNTGGTKPDVTSSVATQKPNAGGSIPTKPPTGKNEKYDSAKYLYDNALSEFNDLNKRIEIAYDEMEEVEQWKADSEALNKTADAEDAARKIENIKQEIEQRNKKVEELRVDMARYKKNMAEAMEDAKKEGNK